MKIFQVLNGICHWDATKKHPSIKDTEGKYSPEIIFVEAPDFVFEGWGYDEAAQGDDRFIKPSLPQPESWTDMATGKIYHWEYDETVGTFYMADENGAIVLATELEQALYALKESYKIIDTLTGEVE